ncbi:MAG: GNAT family N-acetyltransferase [Elusimicrobiota bacterium]|nr:GNAT family N-acetyltransferase [Elusimicrobiota bacterium]
MSDMLVKLYDLPEYENLLKDLSIANIRIKRALAPEKHIILDWVENNFSKGWRSECDAAFSNNPVSCFVAFKEGKVIGFACYDAAAKGFFGPLGVLRDFRKSGIGKALLRATLNAMRHAGYGYAIIGWVSSEKFFAKNVNAILIEDSQPGIYKNLLK